MCANTHQYPPIPIKALTPIPLRLRDLCEFYKDAIPGGPRIANRAHGPREITRCVVTGVEPIPPVLRDRRTFSKIAMWPPSVSERTGNHPQGAGVRGRAVDEVTRFRQGRIAAPRCGNVGPTARETASVFFCVGFEKPSTSASGGTVNTPPREAATLTQANLS